MPDERPSMISLRPVTDADLAVVTGFQLAPGRQRFVSTVADPMQEAIETPAGRPIQWAVYAAETPVGFVMISDEVDDLPATPALPLEAHDRPRPPAPRLWTLDLIAGYFRDRPASRC
jgi:hypothetical protein